MSEDSFMNDESTDLSNDYIHWRLSLIEFDWEEPCLITPPTDAMLSLRYLCYKFEMAHNSEINGLLEELNRFERETMQKSMFIKFMGICDTLFENNQITWGRIINMISVAGVFSLHCVKNYNQWIISHIANWCTMCIWGKLLYWIEGNGGWTIGLGSICNYM